MVGDVWEAVLGCAKVDDGDRGAGVRGEELRDDVVA